MDPQACFRRYVRACEEGDLAEARAARDDYALWILRGGFYAKDAREDQIGRFGPVGERASYDVLVDGKAERRHGAPVGAQGGA